MKRRLACILLAALLLLGLCCTAFAEAPATEAQLWNITDTVGLLTSDEDLTLEARAEEISAQYGVGIYLLILEDYSEYYEDQMLSGTVTCTIAAPYSIGESEYSEAACHNAAGAHHPVKVRVGRHKLLT